MKFTSIYLLPLLLLILGCTKTEKKDIIEISPDYFIDQKVTLSDIGDEIKYIPISSDILFPHYNSIEITDSLIFLGASGAGLLQYDSNGKFIRKIGNRGNGPGEYKYGTDFSIDGKNQRVYISDRNKILVYDFDGNLIREPTALSGSRITYNNNKLYLFQVIANSAAYNPQNYWTVHDTIGNKLYEKINSTTGFHKSNSGSAINSNLVYQFNNKLYYWNHYNDTIFQLQDTLFQAAYLFKKDAYRLTPENAIDYKNLCGFNQYYVVKFLAESKRFLFIAYRQNKKYHVCIYDKHEDVFKDNSLNDSYSITNDMDAGLPFSIEKVINFPNKGYLISKIDAFEIKAHVASEAFKNSTPKYPEKKRKLEKLANSLNENDNPVLMLVKLKE